MACQGRMPCEKEMNESTKSTLSFCKRFNRQLNFLVKLGTEGEERLLKLVNDIWNLVPELAIGGRQQKRALIPVIGNFLGSLFGVATEEDVQLLNSNVEKLSKMVNKDLEVMKKTVSDLSSFATKTNVRFDELENRVKENAMQNIKLIQTVFTETAMFVDYFTNVTLHIFNLQHALDTLEKHYIAYLDSLESLVGGILPVYLVPRRALEEMLVSIQDTLKESDQNYHIIHLDTHFYYKRASFRPRHRIFIYQFTSTTHCISNKVSSLSTYNSFHNNA